MSADYRDPRNDATVDVYVGMVVTHAKHLVETLGMLGDALGDDVELTPTQYQEVSKAVSLVGVMAGLLLVEDARRTDAREGRRLDG